MAKRQIVTGAEFKNATPRTRFLLSAGVLCGASLLVAQVDPAIGVTLAIASCVMLVFYGGAIDGV